RYLGRALPHHDDPHHERVWRAVEGILARLREGMPPAVVRIERWRTPRAVVRGDGVGEWRPVRPDDGRARRDLEPRRYVLEPVDRHVHGVTHEGRRSGVDGAGR